MAKQNGTMYKTTFSIAVFLFTFFLVGCADNVITEADMMVPEPELEYIEFGEFLQRSSMSVEEFYTLLENATSGEAALTEQESLAASKSGDVTVNYTIVGMLSWSNGNTETHFLFSVRGKYETLIRGMFGVVTGPSGELLETFLEINFNPYGRFALSVKEVYPDMNTPTAVATFKVATESGGNESFDLFLYDGNIVNFPKVDATITVNYGQLVSKTMLTANQTQLDAKIDLPESSQKAWIAITSDDIFCPEDADCEIAGGSIFDTQGQIIGSVAACDFGDGTSTCWFPTPEVPWQVYLEFNVVENNLSDWDYVYHCTTLSQENNEPEYHGGLPVYRTSDTCAPFVG